MLTPSVIKPTIANPSLYSLLVLVFYTITTKQNKAEVFIWSTALLKIKSFYLLFISCKLLHGAYISEYSTHNGKLTTVQRFISQIHISVDLVDISIDQIIDFYGHLHQLSEYR